MFHVKPTRGAIRVFHVKHDPDGPLWMFHVKQDSIPAAAHGRSSNSVS
jgi:hypothetical protein